VLEGTITTATVGFGASVGTTTAAAGVAAGAHAATNSDTVARIFRTLSFVNFSLLQIFMFT